MSPLANSDDLPGLRDYSGKQSHSKGVDEILDVVHKLAAAQIPSCVVGVKALFYYGANRITNVRPLVSFIELNRIASFRSVAY